MALPKSLMQFPLLWVVLIGVYVQANKQVSAVPDGWLDFMDMLNYDQATGTMRNNEEASESKELELQSMKLRICRNELLHLRHEFESACSSRLQHLNQSLKLCLEAGDDWQKRGHVFLQRYIKRILRELEAFGLPTEATKERHYDAKIVVRARDIALMTAVSRGGEYGNEGEREKDASEKELSNPGLNHLLDKLLIDFQPHDPESWHWRFEDTFHVELSTFIWLCISVLSIIFCISTELYTRVSWRMQLWRLLIISFLISIPWNWLHLYKLAFAEKQAKIVSSQVPNYCIGSQYMSWRDSLWEWARQSFTLQEDPCLIHHRNMLVDPILEVSPTKALAVTLTTFVLEPVKYLGGAFGDFLRATYHNLPWHLQLVATVLLFSALLALPHILGRAHLAILQQVQYLGGELEHDERQRQIAENREHVGVVEQPEEMLGIAGRRNTYGQQDTNADGDSVLRLRPLQKNDKNVNDVKQEPEAQTAPLGTNGPSGPSPTGHTSRQNNGSGDCGKSIQQPQLQGSDHRSNEDYNHQDGHCDDQQTAAPTVSEPESTSKVTSYWDCKTPVQETGNISAGTDKI
uniref:chloride channel CLIC-like protein 1 isoform X1 n=2 Tax=Myxine glutinosa TaxID=7769 RepID=UPI00358E6586